MGTMPAPYENLSIEAAQAVDVHIAGSVPARTKWVETLDSLWSYRKRLLKSALIGLLVGLAVAFVIPRHFESNATMMPPESSGSSAGLLASMAGRALGGDVLGGLAASLLGSRSNGPLYIDLLRSSYVTGHMIDRFHLQDIYHSRYRVDAAKKLIRRTKVVQEKKSGVISLTVTDTDPVRARDMAQAYLDELNVLVNRTSTSAARRERVFIEGRMATAKEELGRAQIAMSNFSSTHAAVDIREQTRVTVESEAKLQGQMIVTQGELDSLRQIYGDQNVRVRAAEARLGDLKREFEKIGGSSAELPAERNGSQGANPESVSFPPLLQLPRLAVPFANLYRNERVQEAVLDLLTQQYEVSRIQEARDVAAINVIDAPGIPEKKSFPPRTLLILAFTFVGLWGGAAFVVVRDRWSAVSSQDPRRLLAERMIHDLRDMRGIRFRRSRV